MPGRRLRTQKGAAMSHKNDEAAFHEKYIPEPNSGCWLWEGASPNRRYGAMSWRGRRILAHRLSYAIHRGPVPSNMVVDHLCHNGFCVNPEHLEAKTQIANTRRSKPATKTHCRAGHPYAAGFEVVQRKKLGNGIQFRRCLTCYPKGTRDVLDCENNTKGR